PGSRQVRQGLRRRRAARPDPALRERLPHRGRAQGARSRGRRGQDHAPLRRLPRQRRQPPLPRGVQEGDLARGRRLRGCRLRRGEPACAGVGQGEGRHRRAEGADRRAGGRPHRQPARSVPLLQGAQPGAEHLPAAGEGRPGGGSGHRAEGRRRSGHRLRDGEMSLSLFALQLLNGLEYGLLVFLVASGLTLIFGVMGVLNFAHGSFYMLGASLAYWLTARTGSLWLALLIGIPVMVAAGLLLERLAISRLYKRDHLSQVLLTYGLILLFNELQRALWGNEVHGVPAPAALAGALVLGEAQTWPWYRVFTSAACL